jgi:hypothetical protein
MTGKTHYRKAFDSPYLSSADITEPTPLTISHVKLEADKSKKTKDLFNTAYFVEKEIRPGEKLKPMILNAGNCKVIAKVSGSPFIDEWQNIPITVFVDSNVRFGNSIVEGLRITPRTVARKTLTPTDAAAWANAILAAKRDGNLDAVLLRVDVSPKHQALLMAAAHD